MKVEWWPKKAIVLFGGLQLSTQAKWCEMRPCPASKKTEGAELDEGEKYMLLVKAVRMEIDQINLLVVLQLKVHVF